MGILAVFGTLLSTLIVAFGMWAILPLAGLNLPLMYCLLFGALISPTDPIAVMGILKTAGAPKELELVIAGESLFNDGVGVVIFSLLLGMLASGVTPTLGQGLHLLMLEAGGGLLYLSKEAQARTREQGSVMYAPGGFAESGREWPALIRQLERERGTSYKT